MDTSVLLRVVLGEAGALVEWPRIRIAISSELVRVEALRVIDRARIRLRLGDAEVARRRADILDVIAGITLVPLDAAVLGRAADPFPTLLRTLDAIHLASALRARTPHPTVVLATHDVELGSAAASVGLPVIGIAP